MNSAASTRTSAASVRTINTSGTAAAAANNRTKNQDELRAEHVNRFQMQVVHSQQNAIPLDDKTLLKLLLRTIMYDVPWKKPEDERLSEGEYSVIQRIEVAKRMIPCIRDEDFDAAVTEVREEDPIVSLKVMYAEADTFKNMQISPPDAFYDGMNWKNPEVRAQKIREFYDVAQKRARHKFKDDSFRKEESWKVWNFVQNGESMRRAPERADLILPGESFFDGDEGNGGGPRSRNGNNNNNNNNNDNNNGNNNSSEPFAANSNVSGGLSNMGRISSASVVEPDGQFIGGQLSSCFGGVLAIRVHALRFHGKSDPKMVASLPQRLNGSFVFCINTRPQSLENDLSTCAMRSFMTPHTVTDYDLELDDELALPEFHLGNEAILKKKEKVAKANHQRSASLQTRTIGAHKNGNGNNEDEQQHQDDDLPEIDQISLPVLDARAPDHSNKVTKQQRNVVGAKNKFTGGGNNNNNNNDNSGGNGNSAAAANSGDAGDDGGAGEGGEQKATSQTTFFWDFRDEYVTLNLGLSPIRVDFSELVLNFRTPPTCCGIFGVNEICSVRIPMSALYVHILALNSVNRRRHFGPDEEGVHSVHKWFECSPSEKLASTVEEKGSFSVCLSMHMHCRSRAHNKPLFPSWNPFTDPQFDVHKGACRISTDVPAIQQIWREPLHRYFVNLIENFKSRHEDIEINIIENFHNLYLLDVQLLFIWSLRCHLFSGKLFSAEDRQFVRGAAQHLAGLIASGEKLYTYTNEKLANDTKKNAINRFLALPGSLEEEFGEDDRIIHANDALYLAIVVLQTFNFNDLESSVAAAAKNDVAAFFVVACDTIAEIATRFGQHCQEVLKDFSLCFLHMKKAIAFGLKVQKIEERMQQRTQNQQNLTGTRLTASKVIKIRMKVMAEEVCRRLRTAVNHIHVVGANSSTKDRPEAISPLMQLMQAATECGDQLSQFALNEIAHELEGIVPQTFLPMFLSLARERLHSLVGNIVRQFPLEPSKPGRVYSTPAASDAFQFIRATFDEFGECARSCDVGTVLICLGSLMNYLIEAVDVFITSLKEWAAELEETSNPIDEGLAKEDQIAGACLAKFNVQKIRLERTLTVHASLCSFYRLLVDFWNDEATVDFIQNLEAAVSHVGEDEAGSDSEHQVFQSKASMMQACQSAIFEVEVAMIDHVFPSALALPREYVIWSRTCPVKTEEELQDQQRDIAGATAHCIKQVFLAVMHRADREVLRDRLCHVTARGVVTNLISELILVGNMMTAPAKQDMNLRLQRGLLTAIVHVARSELVALCEAAGEQVLQTTSSMVSELDTALAIGLMSSYQLVGTLGDLKTQIEAEAAESKNGTAATTSSNINNITNNNGPQRHKRTISAGISTLKISKEKYEKLLRKACTERAKAGDEACIEYAKSANVLESTANNAAADGGDTNGQNGKKNGKK